MIQHHKCCGSRFDGKNEGSGDVEPCSNALDVIYTFLVVLRLLFHILLIICNSTLGFERVTGRKREICLLPAKPVCLPMLSPSVDTVPSLLCLQQLSVTVPSVFCRSPVLTNDMVVPCRCSGRSFWMSLFALIWLESLQICLWKHFHVTYGLAGTIHVGEGSSVRKGKWSRINTVLSRLWLDSSLYKLCSSEHMQETLNCVCISLQIYTCITLDVKMCNSDAFKYALHMP